MDYTLFLTGLAITLTILILNKITQNLSKPSKKPPLPPGKTGWPLIGETTNFVSCPLKFVVDRMNQNSPDAFQTSLAGETMAVLCGPSANKFIFTNELKYVQSWLPRSVARALARQNMDLNSISYKLAEEVSHKFLKLDCIQQYVGTMDSMVKDHLDKFWVPFDKIKVHPLAKEFTFELSCRIFIEFSNPSLELVKELRDPFFKFIEGIFSTPINVPGMPYHKALKGSKIVQEKLYEIVKQRREKLEKEGEVECRDLLGHFLVARDENGKGHCIGKEDIARIIVGFIFASFYTTTTTIAFVVSFLSKHHHVYEKVLQAVRCSEAAVRGGPADRSAGLGSRGRSAPGGEQLEIKKSKEPGELLTWKDIQKMKYSWSVICETMRLRPPATGGYKEAIADFTFSGFRIPKGWKVFLIYIV